ncbi:MAG: FAD-dependent oxidoreductase [Gammaproteobacteria bacterium]|nr:FAD-dependent oxidoreductase [Gammaproteobacteria bacterium]
MTTDIPNKTEVIVVGGGIIGCSTAYHLARDHNMEVLLLERGSLTCGTTFHAAGLVGQLRSSASITRLLKYSVELYNTLEEETGLATGWKQNGGLRLANNQERWTEIRRQATTARSFGLEMHLLNPKEALDVWPLMDESDLVGAALIPSDGQANPSDITRSLAKGARMHGARIFENISVKEVMTKDGRVVGVSTDKGLIHCEKVVNCAGQWSKALGLTSGVNIPLQSMQHQYIVTEAMAGVESELPTLRDPDRLVYFKEEVGGLVMGGYEPNPKPWDVSPIPDGFQFSLLDEDWLHFEQLMTQAIVRVPAMKTAGVKTLINGPESFTSDGNFILGEAPEVENYFVGTGFNAFGIASAGGAGYALADWVKNGEQPMDLWAADIRRFSALHRDQKWVRKRTIEACSRHYAMAWPNEEYESARPVYTSPLYQRLKDRNACFGSKLGWERPNWFAPDGVQPVDTFSFQRANWFEYVGNEHKACREGVALFDQSSFSKFELRGKDAAKALEWICANRVGRNVGKVVYTQLLNSRGGIECDLTVSRIAEDRFYIVTGTGFRTHDYAWIDRNLPTGSAVRLLDVTEDWATLSLMGPRARDVLSKVTESNLQSEFFPFATVQEIQLAGVQVRAVRITYMGELGWELHIPQQEVGTVYDALMDAGDEFDVQNAGYRAIESLRLEKGYRAWSSDITPNDNPFEAGLGWAVKLDTDISFLGREACEQVKEGRLAKKLCCFSVEGVDTVLHGRETLFRNGIAVGYVTSAGWGYTVQKNIAYGYVKNPDGIDENFLKEGSYELEVACERVPATLELAPLI